MLHAEKVNGYDPLAVIDATQRKKELLLKGEGPAMLEVATYRVSGHSPSDSSTYRSEEEIEEWKAACPIAAYRKKMVEGGIATEEEFDAIESDIIKRITKICRMSIDEEISPRMDLDSQPDIISSIMFSNQSVPSMDPDREAEVLIPKEENPRIKQLAGKVRYAFDEKGDMLPKIKQFGLRDGIFEAILDKFYEDPTLIAYGEDNRDWGGAFAVYRGLTEAIPYHRFFNSPISEAAIVGSAVGYAMAGGRAIVELMYAVYVCGYFENASGSSGVGRI